MKINLAAPGLLMLALAGCVSRGPEKIIAADYERELKKSGGQADVALAYANFLTEIVNSGSSKESKERSEKAERLYEKALADRETYAQAANNLAVMKLKKGDAEGAKTLLEEAAEAMKRYPEGLPIYYFNSGLALERTGSAPDALSEYLKAVDLGFDEAAESAFDVIQKLPPQSQPEAVKDLVGRLARQGRTETAERFLRSSLERVGQGASLEAYLPATTQFLAEARIDPADFRSRWQPFLEDLQPSLSESGRSRLEALIAESNGSRQPSIPMVDPSNPESAVHLATSLQMEPRLDPTGSLLGELVRQAPLAPKREQSAADLDASLRLHAVLGEIFFARGHYGPANKPGTALYHWLAATNFYRSLDAAGHSTERLPVLYEYLGDAYAASCETYKAVVAYHEALAGYWELSYPELAADLLPQVAQLGPKVPADWFDRWRKRLDQAIELSTSGDHRCTSAGSIGDPAAGPPRPGPQGSDVDSSGLEEREVYFSFDKDVFDTDKLKREGTATLNEVAELFRNSGRKIEIRIEGHTDLSGTPDYNRDLGVRRAKTVWNALRALGVPADKIWITSYGMEKPMSEETTEEEKAKDRRVVLRLVQ